MRGMLGMDDVDCLTSCMHNDAKSPKKLRQIAEKDFASIC